MAVVDWPDTARILVGEAQVTSGPTVNRTEVDDGAVVVRAISETERDSVNLTVAVQEDDYPAFRDWLYTHGARDTVRLTVLGLSGVWRLANPNVTLQRETARFNGATYLTGTIEIESV